MFNNLYVKTNYSLLSSLVSIEDLILYANNNNIRTLCICDDNLNSTMHFYNKCCENNIKPIVGLDVTIESNNVLLYAKNYDGYKNLIKLATILSGQKLTIEDLKQYNSNLTLVIPFSSIELYHSIKTFYTDIYIGVINKQEENV